MMGLSLKIDQVRHGSVVEITDTDHVYFEKMGKVVGIYRQEGKIGIVIYNMIPPITVDIEPELCRLVSY